MTDYKKVIVMSQGRTGSTYVCNLIKNNFEQYLINPFDENITDILKKIESNSSILIKDNQIVKLLTLDNDVYKTYIEIINKSFYRIKIIRTDIFHLTLSRIIAEKKEVFYYDLNYNVDPLRIKSDIFIDYLNRTTHHYKNLKDYKNFDKIVYHEDLTGDNQIDFNFLGLKSLSVSTNIKYIKLNYNNIVQNYDELNSIYMDTRNV